MADVLVIDDNNMDLKDLLDEWQLAHLYEHFIEQKITLNILKILKPTHIEKLFENQAVGDQVLFEYKLEQWKQFILNSYSFKKSKASDTNATQVNDNYMSINNIESPSVIVQQGAVVTQIQMSSTSQRSKEKSPPSNAKLPPPPPRCTSGISMRYNLRQILEETNGGQMIISFYEKNGYLKECNRIALINTIASYIESHACGLSIAESKQLEKQIVEMFPTEKEEFYRTNNRGRIYNKVANMKRIYKIVNGFKAQATASGSQTPEPASPCSSISLIKEEEEDHEFLDEYSLKEWRSKADTPEKYLQFWKKSQRTRLKSIADIESLQQILELWPEYKQHNAVEFIHLDFCAKYPEATIFSEVFSNNKMKLEKILYQKISPCSTGFKYMHKYQKCSRDSQNLIILWVMHQLFPPIHKVVVDEMGNKRKKRFSVQDSQNAFICIRNSLAALESALQTRLDTASPPMILVVGELAGDIDQIFAYFEGVRFPMDSVVLAAQLVCELFFLFDLDYPEEAVLYYNFVQTYFLNIEPEVKNTNLYTVINEINAFSN